MDGGMMLLDRASDAGLTVSIAPGDKLVVRGPRRAEETAKLLLAHKADIIPAYWLRLYRDHLRAEQGRGRQDPARMAWEAVAAVWYRAHGDPVRPQICAGCGLPVGSSDALVIVPDKARVHVDSTYNCLIQYGEKWRAAAAAALSRYGVPSP